MLRLGEFPSQTYVKSTQGPDFHILLVQDDVADLVYHLTSNKVKSARSMKSMACSTNFVGCLGQRSDTYNDLEWDCMYHMPVLSLH
jgi:hypothetical protein